MDIFNAMASLISTAISALSQQSINNQNVQNAQDINHQQIAAGQQAAAVANQNLRQNYMDLYSPQAMVNQYKEAGLSPGLMYQMGGNSGTATAPQAQVGQLHMPTIEPLYKEGLGSVMEMMLKDKEIEKKGKEMEEIDQAIENLKQQIQESNAKIQNLLADTENKKVEKMNTELQNDLLTIQKNYENAVFDDKVRIMQESYNKLVLESEKIFTTIQGMNIENDKKDELLQTQINMMNEQINLMVKQQWLTMAQTTTESAKQILYSSEAKLNFATREKIRKEIAVVEAEAERIEQQRDIEWYTLDAYRRGGYYMTNEHGYGKIIGALADLSRDLSNALGRQKKDFQEFKGVPYANPVQSNGFYR